MDRRLLMYLAQAVILLCQQRRRDGLPVPPQLGELCDVLPCPEWPKVAIG
jgi:hypothetical protein